MNEPIFVRQSGPILCLVRNFSASKIKLSGAAGWLVIAFIIQQWVRFGSSIVPSSLLALALFYAAGFLLTMLLFGMWFLTLATMSDAMMMGLSKPSGVAASYGTKFGVIVALLPFTLANYGIHAALLVFVILAFVLREIFMSVGLEGGIGGWIIQARTSHD